MNSAALLQWYPWFRRQMHPDRPFRFPLTHKNGIDMLGGHLGNYIAVYAV